MTNERVREELVGILARELDWNEPVPAGPIERHLDSIQRMSLIVALEDHFRICFEPEDEAGIEDFDDLVRAVTAKVAEAA